MISILRKFKRALKNIVLHYFSSSVKAYWYEKNHNFGDILNPIFIHELSHKKVVWINPTTYDYPNYIVIGSILDRVNRYSTIWGAGFISQESQCPQKPLKVCAVRGPLTRKKLLESGIECPEVYGDPALLLPKIYSPKIEKKYKLGIIAHYIDMGNPWIKTINDADILILNIQSENPYDFIDQVYSCEKIASSSLHGLIVADAYSIPSLWLEFSDKVVGKGFKFHDYFMSVGRKDTAPVVVTEKTTINFLLDNFPSYKIEIDLIKLIKASPFKYAKTLLTHSEGTNDVR
ncbi:MAG TPA: polysaccharide pyruvyl transferase family protein [Campylobacterales bacterium]|nr:polysaccharide pyruvyl transferase family protein [Campylobacterales bacterium]